MWSARTTKALASVRSAFVWGVSREIGVEVVVEAGLIPVQGRVVEVGRDDLGAAAFDQLADQIAAGR